MKTYILVDFSNLIHRCKHVGNSDIVLKTGMTMHIALNSFKKMWNLFEGNHVVVCMDGGSWRRSVYPDYKANRRINDATRSKKEIQDDEFYFSAMDQFADFLDQKTNVTVIKEKGIEADDIIARWIYLHPDDNHIILSGDSDFYQLLSDNVKIYDGVKDHIISTSSVIDNNTNLPVVKTKNIKKKNSAGIMETKKESSLVLPPNPKYELFKKIVRGDSSDNIMTAYPGVREKGTAKKPGIIEAFEDMTNKGYDWNSFMLTEWDKVFMEDGEVITKKVRVLDEYKINEQLIDLTKQPLDIKEKIDNAICSAVDKTPVSQVGIRLMKFCEDMALTNIGRNPNDYAKILNSRYS